MENKTGTEWMGQYRELVEKIIRLCNESSTRFCRPADYHTPVKLSAHEMQIMEYILESKDEKMSDIAKRLGVTRGAFSNNVTKLIALGCLEKECRGDNKKNRYVIVTPYGREVYKKYSEFAYERSFREIFKMADTIPKEYIDTFGKMLEYFTDTLV